MQFLLTGAYKSARLSFSRLDSKAILIETLIFVNLDRSPILDGHDSFQFLLHGAGGEAHLTDPGRMGHRYRGVGLPVKQIADPPAYNDGVIQQIDDAVGNYLVCLLAHDLDGLF